MPNAAEFEWADHAYIEAIGRWRPEFDEIQKLARAALRERESGRASRDRNE